MSYRYGKDDVHFVVSKIKAGIKLRDVNDLYHFWRTARGTETEKGDYTNFVSKLSPNSKHLEKTVTAAHEHTEKNDVIQKIRYCLNCSKKEASKVYRTRVVPVCVSRFHDPSAADLVSVRYYAGAPCNSYLYIMFVSQNYEDEIGDVPAHLRGNDLWTIRTEHEYRELLDGSLTKDDILAIISENNKGPEQELVNVCVNMI